MIDLKPCPFCGETPKEIVDATKIMGVYRIVHRCKVIPPFALDAATPEKVAENWNWRAPEAQGGE
jgi:Lar family restriction alleviation protein